MSKPSMSKPSMSAPASHVTRRTLLQATSVSAAVAATGSARYVTGPWRYERVEDAGHWLQLDAPDTVNALLLDFLGQQADRTASVGVSHSAASSDNS